MSTTATGAVLTARSTRTEVVDGIGQLATTLSAMREHGSGTSRSRPTSTERWTAYSSPRTTRPRPRARTETASSPGSSCWPGSRPRAISDRSRCATSTSPVPGGMTWVTMRGSTWSRSHWTRSRPAGILSSSGFPAQVVGDGGSGLPVGWLATNVSSYSAGDGRLGEVRRDDAVIGGQTERAARREVAVLTSRLKPGAREVYAVTVGAPGGGLTVWTTPTLTGPGVVTGECPED